MKQRVVWIIAALNFLSGCSMQNPSTAVEETRQACLPAGKVAKKDLAICGSKSLWGYYSKLGFIGVLNLAGGNISDLQIFEYEDYLFPERDLHRLLYPGLLHELSVWGQGD